MSNGQQFGLQIGSFISADHLDNALLRVLPKWRCLPVHRSARFGQHYAALAAIIFVLNQRDIAVTLKRAQRVPQPRSIHHHGIGKLRYCRSIRSAPKDLRHEGVLRHRKTGRSQHVIVQLGDATHRLAERGGAAPGQVSVVHFHQLLLMQNIVTHGMTSTGINSRKRITFDRDR
jgi:hypothetical protein